MANFTNIRYGKLRLVGRFKTDRDDLRVRDRCVVKTDRGKELGEVLSALEPMPETLPPESLWDVLRRANPDDLQNAERLEKENIPRARRTCKEEIEKLKLPMKLTEVDYVLGGERIIFYFTSQTRIDFRELVRQLAREFRTRIELKQVGARDEARLVGDAGHCGLTLCCRGHLKELGGITMDMAKVQKHTADPSKITGRCGKLLCCLRYEYSWYTEGRKLLPGKGKVIETVKGQKGRIIDQNLLMREVTIDVDGNRTIVKADEIKGAAPAVAGCNGCAEPKAGAAEKAPAPQEAKPPTPDTTRLETREADKISKDTTVAAPVMSAPMWMLIGKAGDFEAGKGRIVELGEKAAVAVFRIEDKVHVLRNDCPHQGGPLGDGALEGTVVTCPWHQWKFDVTTGKCQSVSGSGARRFDVEVLGEDVFIRV